MPVAPVPKALELLEGFLLFGAFTEKAIGAGAPAYFVRPILTFPHPFPLVTTLLLTL